MVKGFQRKSLILENINFNVFVANYKFSRFHTTYKRQFAKYIPQERKTRNYASWIFFSQLPNGKIPIIHRFINATFNFTFRLLPSSSYENGRVIDCHCKIRLISLWRNKENGHSDNLYNMFLSCLKKKRKKNEELIRRVAGSFLFQCNAILYAGGWLRVCGLWRFDEKMPRCCGASMVSVMDGDGSPQSLGLQIQDGQ